MDVFDCNDLALKKVKIHGNILGKFGRFEINQIFENDTKQPLEVTYTFPLVETATVIGFEVKIGKKLLVAKSKESKEAKKEYTDSMYSGNSAFMLEKNADNIFKVSIGKVDKKETVEVKIVYLDKFEIVDGNIKVLIPTLVYPRYNVSERPNPTYGLEYKDVNYTVDFDLDIDNSVEVKSISSPSHGIKVYSKDQDTLQKVTVEDQNLSKDFILNIELKKENTAKLIFSRNEENENITYVSFMPEFDDVYEDDNKDYIFIIDISGSMSGDKIAQTKNAVKKCLLKLDEGDTFNIIPFSNDYKAMSIESMEATAKNIKKAAEYIDSLEANGGTEILKPVKFSLYEKDVNKVILLFTDGQVSNAEEIYDFIRENINNSKIFPFGIDYNINSSFIRKIAKYGHGKAEFITPKENIEEKIVRMFDRITSPIIEDVKVDFGKSEVLDQIKEDDMLFNYEYFNVFTKVRSIENDVTIKGKVNGKKFSKKIPMTEFKKASVDLNIIYQKELLNRLEEYLYEVPRFEQEKRQNYIDKIVEIATKYNIDSKYTTYVVTYERKNKIFEVPVYQNTPLSGEYLESGNSFVMGIPRMRSSAMPRTSASKAMPRDMGVPTFLRQSVNKSVSADLMMEDADASYMMNMPAIGEDLSIKEHKKVQLYYMDFAKGKKKKVLTYILFQIYLLETKVSTNFEKFISEIKDAKELSEEKYQKLLYRLYMTLESINERNKQKLVYDILSDKFKKMIDTDYELDDSYEDIFEKDFKIKVEKIEDIKKYFEENSMEKNINSILVFLIVNDKIS